MYRLTACLLFCALFLNARMSFAEPTQPLCGTVLTPYGTPAEGATVALTTCKHRVSIQADNKIHTQKGKEHYVLQTDQSGKFQFDYFDFQNEQQGWAPPATPDYAIYITHESGFCYLPQKDMETLLKGTLVPPEILLDSWGRIEGTVSIGTKPAQGVQLSFRPTFDVARPEFNAMSHHRAASDENGRFVFEQVPACKGTVTRGIFLDDSRIVYGDFGSNRIEVDVSPSGIEFVTLGGKGRAVIGKLVREEGFDLSWEECVLICVDQPERPDKKTYDELFKAKVPETIKEEEDINQQYKLLSEWEETTEEGKAFAPIRRAYERNRNTNINKRNNGIPAGISEDGTFRIDELPEGNWQLEIDSSGGWMRGIGEEVNTFCAVLDHRFTMEPIPNGVSDDPLDLGTLTVKEVK